MEKLVQILKTIREFLNSTVGIGKNLVIIIAAVYLLYSLPLVWDSVVNGGKTKITKVEKIDTPTIQEATKSDTQTSEQMFTEINNAEPVVVLPPTATETEVQRSIDELKGDYVISTPSTTPGSSIYSIRVRRALYGVGLYADTDKEVGLHYRNKRWIYQVGIDKDAKPNCRIVYELIQW